MVTYNMPNCEESCGKDVVVCEVRASQSRTGKERTKKRGRVGIRDARRTEARG